jgi:hypothetical protein
MAEPAQTLTTWQIYQPLVVGLGAVVLGTLGNTLLEWYKQHIARSNASEGLRRALAAELKLEKQTADENANAYKDTASDEWIIVPIPEHHPIYDGAIGQLGLLKPKQIEKVVYAYASLKERFKIMAVIGSFLRVEGGTVLYNVEGKWGKEVLAKRSADLSATLEDAIRELER